MSTNPSKETSLRVLKEMREKIKRHSPKNKDMLRQLNVWIKHKQSEAFAKAEVTNNNRMIKFLQKVPT